MSEIVHWIDSLVTKPQFGMLDSSRPDTLCFLGSHKFLHDAMKNEKICFLIVIQDLVEEVRASRPDIKCFVSQEPLRDFYVAHNFFAEKILEERKRPTSIPVSCKIGQYTSISEHNVEIGEDVIIEEGVVIQEGVKIHDRVVIRAGAKIGVEGFEFKRVGSETLGVVHDGSVEIFSDVTIGANNTICKGLLGNNTIIGNWTKTDCLVHIAHGASIGEQCLIAASAVISGSVTVEDSVWIGPNATITNGVNLGASSNISIGSVVIKDVKPHHTVAGNFAVNHLKYMRWLGREFKEL